MSATLLHLDRREASHDAGPVLASLRALLDDFEQHAVIYCYWKHSSRVVGALGGTKDLDLLVARHDQHRIAGILLAHGFKLFGAVPSRQHPSVSSYVGHDVETGMLVHVHLHQRLIVGERVLKNYRLPWESELLARAVRHPDLPIRILDPASEALVTMARACLELSLLDPLTVRNWTFLSQQAERDVIRLGTTVEAAEFHAFVLDLLGTECADAALGMLSSPEPLSHGPKLRQVLLHRIGGYRQYNGFEARLRSIGHSLAGLMGRLNRRHLHAPRPWNRIAPGGGCVVAVVGLDGSGKSTANRMLRQWLSTEMDVLPIYFGTGEGRPSIVLLPFKLLLPLMEVIFRKKPQGSSHGTITGRPPGVAFSLFLTVWATAVALEKRMKLLMARRAAARGMVVIADRYPQNEILRFNDGPLLPRLRHVPAFLRRFEETTYRRAAQMPPDLVLKLVITPETAGRREPTMDRALIAERIDLLQRLAFPGARVVCIDAEQPLPEVAAAIRRHVWELV